MNQKVRVNLGARSYDAVIGPGALDQIVSFTKKRKYNKIFAFYDSRISSVFDTFQVVVSKSKIPLMAIPIEAGEKLKSIENIFPLFGQLIENEGNRDSLIVAIGGGSVGDAIGFVASTFLRGVDWIGIPTTLLAQVDSCLGGKTGINHPAGKNLIGSFYQPKLVICDSRFLTTLSERELISGLGEVLKYGLTFDPKFYSYLEKNWQLILDRDQTALRKCIFESLKWKSKAVAKDEYDLKGIREVLNFGHTFGHGFEKITGFNYFQHGEAVLLGMRMALAVSVVRGHLKLKAFQKIDNFLSQISVPALPQPISVSGLMNVMGKDKKVKQGAINFVLLSSIGKIKRDTKVTVEHLKEAFDLLKIGWKE